MPKRKMASVVEKQKGHQEWKPKTVLIAIVLALVLIGVALGPVDKNMSRLFPLENVDVVGQLTRVNEQQVRDVVMQTSSQNMLLIELNQVRQSVEKLSWVKSANVRKIWPNTLLIEIEEFDVIARWNKQKWLSNTGQVVNKIKANVDCKVASLFGPKGSEDRVLNTMLSINDILSSLRVKIEALRLSLRGAWTIQLDNGWILYVGKESLFERVVRFVSSYETIRQEFEGAIKYVDLRYDTGFAIMPERKGVQESGGLDKGDQKN